jgi:hypothetical protein
MSLRYKDTNSKVNEDPSRRFTFKGTEMSLLLVVAFLSKACRIADRNNVLRFVRHVKNTTVQMVNVSCKWNDIAQCPYEKMKGIQWLQLQN